MLQRYRDKEIRVCGKNSIPLNSFREQINVSRSILRYSFYSSSEYLDFTEYWILKRKCKKCKTNWLKIPETLFSQIQTLHVLPPLPHLVTPTCPTVSPPGTYRACKYVNRSLLRVPGWILELNTGPRETKFQVISVL